MNRFNTYPEEKLRRPVHIAPLAVFRVIFGSVMFGAVIRFLLKGWVYDLYIAPKFYFTYYGFEWVKPLGAYGMYAVFILMAVSYLAVMLGWQYRIAIITAFLSFTYVELIDKSNYLNHYYFVSVISFLMIWLPANRHFSLDTLRKPALKLTHVPAWTIHVIKLQLAIVYIYAGIAKLNYDWLFRAMPLKIWLPANSDLPVIGGLMHYEFTAYLFSWFGAVYDLFIVFFLLNKRTRLVAYGFVIAFHVMTKIMFPIGMFPYVMIFSTLIFFSEDFHKRVISFFRRKPAESYSLEQNIAVPVFKNRLAGKIALGVLGIHFMIQLLFPWRFVLYPGQLFWTEQGYRFSWRVMLMEKAGTAFFHVHDSKTGRASEVMNDEFLTRNQEKMMATQPDMIIQYAHLLKEEYRRRGIQDPVITAESYVTLNGSGSRPFINDSIDLAKLDDSFSHKTWILPFH